MINNNDVQDFPVHFKANEKTKREANREIKLDT